MENRNRSNRTCRILMMVAAGFAALFLPLGLSNTFGESPALSSTSQETLRLGERMYRQGILPSGKSMVTSVTGGLPAPGTTFACASCHLRSGAGALDENVYIPPVSATELFRPRRVLYKGFEQNPENSQSPPLRPAYTDETLTTVIRSGRDPAGRVLNNIMPRYILEDRDVLILVNYLKSLSSQFSPGVTDTTIRLATVSTEDVTPEDRDAMLSSLESSVKSINNQVAFFKTSRGARGRQMIENMLISKEFTTRTLGLSHWVLKGPQDTWRGQLEDYYRREPVFALVGGIAKGDWKPIHQFSEDNKIPCLLPNTDFPVISDTDWYTLYLSKGYYQEGESVALYLNSRDDLIKGKALVQLVRTSPEGQALSSGFQQTWQSLGHPAPVSVPLPGGKGLSKTFLAKVLSKNKPAVLILWDDAASLPVLELLAGRQNRPELVFVSSRYLGKSIWTLPDRIRDFTYLTYPFAFSPYVLKSSMDEPKAQIDPPTLKQADVSLRDNIQKITSLTKALSQLMFMSLMNLKGHYYRDNLLDVMGTMMSLPYPLVGQISFGPSQRYGSKGCYIVQLSKGDNPALVRKSNWEIH